MRDFHSNSFILCSVLCNFFKSFILIAFWKFQVWDLGGQTSIRPYWRCYYPNTDAIIFVVDSADTERMNVARGELQAMLEEEELKGAILLVFANKQDQKGALNAQQISDALSLPEVRNRQWSIQETSALKGKGLFEGFDWLVTCIKGDETSWNSILFERFRSNLKYHFYACKFFCNKNSIYMFCRWKLVARQVKSIHLFYTALPSRYRNKEFVKNSPGKLTF